MNELIQAHPLVVGTVVLYILSAYASTMPSVERAKEIGIGWALYEWNSHALQVAANKLPDKYKAQPIPPDPPAPAAKSTAAGQ